MVNSLIHWFENTHNKDYIAYKALLFLYNKELNRNAVFAGLTYPKKRLNRKKLVRRHILICDLVSSIYTRFVRVVVVHVCRIWKRKYHKRKIKERRFKSRLKAREIVPTYIVQSSFIESSLMKYKEKESLHPFIEQIPVLI